MVPTHLNENLLSKLTTQKCFLASRFAHCSLEFLPLVLMTLHRNEATHFKIAFLETGKVLQKGKPPWIQNQ